MSKVPNFTESRSAGTRVGGDYIGITRSGAMSFYSEFYKKAELKSFTGCLLLVDKAQNLIGLQFGSLDSLGVGAYSINHNEKTKTGWMSTPNFFKTNNLSIPVWFGKYEAEKVCIEGRENTYMIDLEKKKPVLRTTKKAKAV